MLTVRHVFVHLFRLPRYRIRTTGSRDHLPGGIPYSKTPLSSHRNDVVRQYIIERLTFITKDAAHAQIDDDLTTNSTRVSISLN